MVTASASRGLVLPRPQKRGNFLAPALDADHGKGEKGAEGHDQVHSQVERGVRSQLAVHSTDKQGQNEACLCNGSSTPSCVSGSSGEWRPGCPPAGWRRPSGLRRISTGGSTANGARMMPSRANPATLEATERKAVTGVGAPWYTSGIHSCMGTAPILNAVPSSSMARARYMAGARLAGQGVADDRFIINECSRNAEIPGQAENEKPRADGAQNQVLDARFRGTQVPPEVAYRDEGTQG